jgi:hypothetical protein
MGKYSRLNQQASLKPRPWDVHPIWRGIGCLFFLIGPFIAFAAADLIVQLIIDNGWYPIPPELSRQLTVVPLGLTLRHFYGNLMVTAILLLLGFALIMVVYSVIYALMGPSRYGPLDAPPIRRKTRPSR